jgi:hypothetical protein
MNNQTNTLNLPVTGFATPATTRFTSFAPAILKIYRRDKEAFWAAVLAPFLADSVSLLDWWEHLKIDLELLAAFKGLDDEARQLLRDFSFPLGIDVTRWKSNRLQYFKDAYPIFAFLVIWLDEMGLGDLLARFNDILRSAVFGVAGYGILDENVDSNTPSPVEILASQALVAEYEALILDVFGVTPTNLGILHKMRGIFLAAEVKEKNLRWKSSPYTPQNPQDCGGKGAHVVTPFMLSLEKLGRAHQIDDYWQVFLLFGAVIQIIDDWADLEKDLAIGHYSLVALGVKDLPLAASKPQALAKTLRADQARVGETYRLSQEMLAEARAILARLDDPFLARLVDVTELRLQTYFRKELRFFSSST